MPASSRSSAVAPDETALVVLERERCRRARRARPSTEGGACLHTSLPAGSTLKDVMPGTDGKTFTVKGDGTVDVSVPARSGRVLVKQ